MVKNGKHKITEEQDKHTVAYNGTLGSRVRHPPSVPQPDTFQVRGGMQPDTYGGCATLRTRWFSVK